MLSYLPTVMRDMSENTQLGGLLSFTFLGDGKAAMVLSDSRAREIANQRTRTTGIAHDLYSGKCVPSFLQYERLCAMGVKREKIVAAIFVSTGFHQSGWHG